MERHTAQLTRRKLEPGTLLRVLALSLVACAFVVVSGCAKAQAKVPTEGPPLSVPDPPARVLSPVVEPEPIAATVPETPPAEPPRPPARPPARRPAAPAAAETETKPEPAQPTANVPAPTPQPTLRAAPSAADATAERTVRETLARAARDLNRVDYGRLGADARAQY
jgi:hypothetical protein